jgi:uncharacterized protein
MSTPGAPPSLPSLPSPYEWIQHHPYVSLTTFKKSGQRVETPIWFATAGGKLYMYSELDAGKMKRIRNNARIEVAPCTFRGKVIGPSVSGTALELSAEKGVFVHELLNRKYTWKKRIFELGASVPEKLGVRKGNPEGYLEISLD